MTVMHNFSTTTSSQHDYQEKQVQKVQQIQKQVQSVQKPVQPTQKQVDQPDKLGHHQQQNNTNKSH
ncbi:hypothetical protein DICPUDRAFT_156952 [Dictyostelium purpureum]|uniref:Uncharacterized protein n=1 Tax=Dictyostelium purpureum TaxID=5786 RepID=F0ZXV7_DICPU|nr:uncharacterized protein DICPUDRAFT_156952 [Dictyostelium purpureum]EGC31224.1 hypothetical protein DICPUDRAFT_156952 [Dictyostelium purpureum]|eukprot:XP_003292254.1 hypothetical protein DICPUDRAFT_156952 [Dictyostelium purpureum]